MIRHSEANKTPNDLSSWLSYIERLHPSAIEMGLTRVKSVIQRLNLKPDFRIITVAGTNGKGSTCAMLAQIYQQAGYQVGCYTSPHILRYNERVQVNGVEASDDALCDAFSAIERARQAGNDHDETRLTYFEMGTLAAVWHFMQASIDVAILEIGLGGRLDAVNAFEPDCAIVTNVDLDHQDFLGDTRELIGFEKAGVYRSEVPAICGDINPPHSLIEYANEIGADLKCLNHAFGHEVDSTGWYFLSEQKRICHLAMPALHGDYQLNNAACAVAAVSTMQSVLPVGVEAISRAMHEVSVAGRFNIVSKNPWLILDVAHNPHAAKALAGNLHAFNQLNASMSFQQSSVKSRTLAVFSMLADKDIKSVVEAVNSEIDVWYVAAIDHLRGATLDVLVKSIAETNPHADVKVFDTVIDAYRQAIIDIEGYIERNENDKIIVFGSFFTVSSVMQFLNDHVTSSRKQ